MTRRILYTLAVLLTLPTLSYSGEPDEAAGTEAEGPMLKAPLTKEEAIAAQKECGKRLGILVEITNSIGMKLKLIPAGEFMMGSSTSPQDLVRAFGWDEDVAKALAGGPRRVRITKPFYLGMYEVTQAEFEEVMGKNPSRFSKGGGGAEEVSGEDTSRHPVETVSWEDVTEFCKRLSVKEGKTYRLPTEAEWEYACRAGTTTQWSFGDAPASFGEHGWHCGNSDRKTHPVGEKKPNAWGLHDMHGNVEEWCADWHDPWRPETGSLRVYRGGGWFYGPRRCRSSWRTMCKPGSRGIYVGFRVAADPPSKSSQGQANKQAEPRAEAEASHGEIALD